MNCLNGAQRRYLWRFFSTIAAYVVLFAMADSAFHRHHPTGLIAIILALAPGLAIVANIVVVGLYIAEEQDEFQRFLFIRSILWGVGVTLAFTTVEGFLELFIPISKFQLYEVYPFFWIVAGLAQGFNSWYYGSRKNE